MSGQSSSNCAGRAAGADACTSIEDKQNEGAEDETRRNHR